MPNLVPASSQGGGLARPGTDYRASRQMAALERRTLLQVAEVESRAIVHNEMIHEVDRLTSTAMTGQAMLLRWRDTLAAGDPMVAEDLRFFTDVARLAKGEVIADSVDCMRRSC